MAANSSVHSNAFNFMSYLQGGVDPRTGLYTLTIRLPEVKANDLQGPPLQLALTFSPLNTVDSGYGKGWNLLLSQFVPSTGVVSTLDGEVFKAEPGQGRFTLQEQKLDSFHLHDQGNQRYRLVHRSGLVEVLGIQGVGDNALALPEEVYSAQGHRLRFSYTGFNVHTRLASITYLDDNFESRPVLLVERTDQQVIFRFNPEGEQQAVFTLKLDNSQRVEELVLPTAENASWRLRYEDALNLGYDCIKEVFTPTGGHETLTYTDAHEFPRAYVGDNPAHIIPPPDLAQQPPARLPRVSQHWVDPGAEQPPIDTRYSYTLEEPGSDYQAGNNFLGANLTLGWSNDGLDNLFRYPGVYLYGSVEQLLVEGTVVRKIQRHFNQFHLLTEERTLHLDADAGRELTRQVQSTRYHLKLNVAFKDQERYCQLPGTVTTSWRGPDAEGQPRSRSERTSQRTYHPDGNLHTETDVSGVTQTREWYPAAGEGSDSPPDPDGFVRHLKSLTTTPAPSDEHPDAPVLRQRYRYRHHAPLRNAVGNGWHEACEERLLQVGRDPQSLQEVETELELTVYEHLIDPGDPFSHGRPARQAVTRNGETTTTAFAYRKRAEAPGQGETVLVTEQTITGHDGEQKVQTLEHSILIGEPLLNYDDNDVKIRYQYDALRRVVSETVAPGEEHEATRHYAYTLSSREGQRAEQRLTNAHGVCTTTVVDGLSRTVTQQRDHIDDNEPTRAFEILATDYDAFGRQLIETQTDYLPDYALDNASMLQPLCLTRSFAYDEWGNLSRTTEPDGVEVHEQTNPLGHARHEGPVQRTWRQTAGADRLISGLRETWFTPFDEPEHILRFDADGRELARQVFSYDGLGNLRTQVNEQGDATHHHYDAWNRLTSTERPDRAKVDRRYAAHSSSEVATRISVTPATSASPIILGEQVLDGLERPVELKVGKQRETLAYSDGSTLPASRRTAAGDEVRYHYAPNLTQAPVRTEIDDDVSDFDFHPRSARLIHASNHEGSQRYEYDVNNRLSARHWINEDGTTYSIAQATSLQGRQTSQTLASGLEKRTEYDEFGRPSLTRQGDLQAAFAYDRLGRPRSTVTQDLVGQTTLTTTIDYDDQDREILRTFEQVGQPTQTLEQGWGLDGLLASRHLRQGSTSLLEETFTYDKLGQLTQHTCAGTQLPKDRQGREIRGQHFTYGAFHNIERCETRFSDTSTETLRFTYENDDPCQLTAVSFDPPAARPAVALVHDANGNLLNDHLGFQMRYDKRSRLLSVNAPDGRLLCEYRYDAHGQLHALGHADGTQTRLVFQDNRLSVAIRDAVQTSILYDQDRPLGQQQSGGADATLLLRCNASQSVIAESQGQNLRQASYGAYGERTDAHPLKCLLGYNGEFVDPDTGWYLLGQGYRAYNPALMRFQGPDSLSPFEAGGLNRYAYVAGNPIGLRDPTGRYFQLSQTPENYAAMGAGRSMLGAIFGFILGAIMTVVATVATVLTAGAAAPSIGAAVGFTATVSAASGTLVSVAGASAGLVSTVSQGIGMFANNPLALKIAEYSGYASMLSVLNPGLVTKSVTQWMGVATNTATPLALPRMLQAGIQGLMQRAPGTAAAAGSSSFVARAATTLAGASTAPTTPRRAIRPGNSSTPIANSRVTSQASARAEEPVASSMRVRE